MRRDNYPSRIVCLTEETTETLYLLGEQDRIVGISGFTVRPPQARREKPKISTFTSANIGAIVGLRPDLVLAFSDLQAEIVRELIQCGQQVVTFNQRSIAEILQMVRIVGALVGRQEEGERLAARLADHVESVRAKAAALTRRVRVFFEEWPDPLISGIQWVSEIVEAAGGVDVFHELRAAKLARDRVVAIDSVPDRNPELILASWCGKKVKRDVIRERRGWERTLAVQRDAIVEIPSSIILQPGPAALSDGIDRIHRVISSVARGSVVL